METNKSSKRIEPYQCAIKTKDQFFDTWLTVGHIPRKLLHQCFYFIKEGRTIAGHLISTAYKASPIPATGTGAVNVYNWIRKTILLMRDFAKDKDLYNYDYTGENNEDESDEDEEIILNLRDNKMC